MDSRRLSSQICALLSVAALAAALILHVHRTHAFLHADLVEHPDEGAHFASAAMVHDYLTTAIGHNPLEFAREFYWRHPKVAIGHWPPGFYAMLGVWFLPFGATVASARIFCSLLIFGIAAVLFRWIQKEGSPALGAGAAAVFLTSALVVRIQPMVMTDAMVCLCSLLALESLRKAVLSSNIAHFGAFVLFTGIAVWTKGSGWALIPSALSLPLLMRRTKTWLHPRYLGALGLTVVLGVPFYLWASSANLGNSLPSPLISLGESTPWWSQFWFEVARRGEVIRPLWNATGWRILLPAAATCLWAVLPSKQPTGKSGVIPVALAAIAGQLMLQVAVPSTFEARYYLVSLCGGILLLAEGLRRTVGVLAPPGLALCALAGLLAASGREAPQFDYRDLSRDIDCANCVTVAAMDSSSEGALIAWSLTDGQRSAVTLRGSKVLARSDWNGGNYVSKFHDSDEMRQYLEDLAPDYVVLGSPRPAERLHIRLCREAIASSPGFQLQATSPAGAQVYRRLQPASVRQDWDRIRMLQWIR